MPNTTSVNLGQVSAVIAGPTPPSNTNVVWLDTSGSNTVKKIYDPIAQVWTPLTQSATVAGDNWGTQVVVSDGTLSGEGITGNVLKNGPARRNYWPSNAVEWYYVATCKYPFNGACHSGH